MFQQTSLHNGRDIHRSNGMAQYGTTSTTPPLFSLHQLPQIFSEWAGLTPFAVYLASSHYAYPLVGKISLAVRGSLAISIFPRLGALGDIARLLEGGTEYVDRACSVGDCRKEVWDVNWGSVFPCANGGACEAVLSAAMRSSRRRPIRMPDFLPLDGSLKGFKEGQCNDSSVTIQANHQTKKGFRRYQTLHVIRVTRGLTLGTRYRYAFDLAWKLAKFALLLILVSGMVILCMFGLWGTAAAVLVGLMVGLVRELVIVIRPQGYLEDNEKQRMGGCMLISTHSNASHWYLYIGDRGVIDNLLNKSMIHSVTSRIGGETGSWLIAKFLRLLSVIQLLVMTFVAAQKGWDGVALLVFVALNEILDKLLYRERSMASDWMNKSGIVMEAKSFEFTGRTPMLGAIQLFKNNPVHSWMDTILVPCERRKVWLDCLTGRNPGPPRLEDLNLADRSWVEFNLAHSRHAAAILAREFTEP